VEVGEAIVTVGGTTGGVAQGQLTGVQTGSRLHLHCQRSHRSVRETLLEVGEQKTGSHQTWVLYLLHLLSLNQWNSTKNANHAHLALPFRLTVFARNPGLVTMLNDNLS
jgi:hypothetical protein